MMIRKPGIQLGALLLVVASQGACKDEQTSNAQRDAAANANEVQALNNPKLREALAPPSASPSARAAEDGPPPNGVFEKGQADARHAKGAPVKIQIGGLGSDPKVQLGTSTAELKGPVKVTVGVKTGPRSALPNVDLTLAIKLEKPKDKLADGGVGAAAIIAKVDKATLSASQPGQLPAGADKEIAKLAGSSMRIVPSANGGAEDIVLTVDKSVGAELKYVLFGAADSIFALYVPVPDKPVGVGAAWIAESRNSFSGVDLVAYRLYRVKSIDNGAATIDVEVRQYASSTQEQIEGLPPGGLQQFDSTSHGHLKLNAGETFAAQGDTEQKRVMLLQDGQQRMLPIQLMTECKLTR